MRGFRWPSWSRKFGPFRVTVSRRGVRISMKVI